MTDEAEISRRSEVREISAWRRLGPVMYRLRALSKVVRIVACSLLLLIVLNTVRNLYPGTGTQFRGPRNVPVAVSVQECWRVGPYSGYGFGFWRECRVVVHRNDGSEGKAVIGRSLLSEDDVGKTFDLMESCYDEARTDCAYGRALNKLWELYPRLLTILARAILITGIRLGIFELLRMALGPPRYFALVDKVRRRRK